MINALAELAGEAAEWTAKKLTGRSRQKLLDEDTRLIVEISVGSLLAGLAGLLFMLLEFY